MKLADFHDKKFLLQVILGLKVVGSTWLSLLGAKVYGFSDKINTDPSHFNY